MERKIKKRLLDIPLKSDKSFFLWGPRKVGKTYWITHNIKNAVIIDLLKTDVFADYASRPSLLRERYQNHKGIIVIDEIQKLPVLLNEIHWLIENKHIPFIITGSSARKLKNKNVNLLGGRAWRRVMTPLSLIETEGFDIENIMISGLLPPHFLSTKAIEDLRGYTADYLKEEIAQEAIVRNIPSFSEFLKVAAITSSELLNYTNVARESGVSSKVVRNYFDILEDTYLGFRVHPWRKSKNRRLIETEKFYLFDIGITNYLCGRAPKIGTPEFGKSFEQYILMELKAFKDYRNPELDIRFWRTASGYEVDFILGEGDLALEVKGSSRVWEVDAKGLIALSEEMKIKRKVIVCLEKEPRIISGDIEIEPWELFINKLWGGEYL
ncbi:MAG: ATP-binding protein [Elusimicrobia bacterium]|nr:ATP-binding protein [Elusimicrobiota bacterium]